MWPQALQMTRDECRGILRRLELESYSHVISVFRAQGGLNDSKTKILEELRTLLHISQERHRAEARRVANDEQLATISEAISGPNTWQEWSREGRRPYPLLPRVAPQTALALIANNIAAETAVENAKLPYPAQTASAVVEEQAVLVAMRAERPWDGGRGYSVVESDPFKMPEIPAAPKKNLKRNNPSDNHSTTSNKKRLMHGETSPGKLSQQQQQHISGNTQSMAQLFMAPSSNIRKLYHNHSKLQQQQRFFHQQQQAQKQKQSAKKTSTAAANASAAAVKRQATSKAKGGGKSTKAQKLQLLRQQQQPQLSLLHLSSYLGSEVQSIAAFEDQQQQQPHLMSDPTLGMPQIAASKRDITKNLTKLQIPVVAPCAPPSISTIAAHEHQTAATAAGGAVAATSPMATTASVTKPLLSTPVQKYIVEDRQLPTIPGAAGVVASPPQLITVTPTKMRSVNATPTAQLPPGTKMTPKKLPLEQATVGGGIVTTTSQPQVFSIIDSGGGGISTTPSTGQPTHAPPAVMQLHSSGIGNATVVGVNCGEAVNSPAPYATQGKVLTTKLVPIVLGGGDTLNNGATVVSSSALGAGGTIITKTLVPVQGMGGAGFSGSSTAGNILLTTPGTPGSPVYRKPAAIFKTSGILGMAGGIIGMGASTPKLSNSAHNPSTSSDGPQILSNIKLTPAITTTPVAVATSLSGGVQQAPHFLKSVTTSSGIRPNVKICQSPNGKVFIQSTSNVVDALRAKKPPLMTANTTLLGGASSAGGMGTASQRITIQKVQIIPAQSTSSSVAGQRTATVTIGNKSNMVFLPASAAAGMRTAGGTITLSKGGMPGGGAASISNMFTVRQPQQQQLQKQQHHQTLDAGLTKPNVVVIGPSSVLQTQSSAPTTTIKTTAAAALSDGGGVVCDVASASTPADSSQMITEDTPVDILNLPIIVENSSGVGGEVAGSSTIGNNIGDTVTVLASGIVKSSSSQQPQHHQEHQYNQQRHMQVPQQQSSVILSATDWEMELDQATAVAAASKARFQPTAGSGVGSTQQQLLQQEIVIDDDNYEDVIIEEHEESDATTQAACHAGGNDAGNVILDEAGVGIPSTATTPASMEVGSEEGRSAQKRKPSQAQSDYATNATAMILPHRVAAIDENTAIEFEYDEAPESARQKVCEDEEIVTNDEAVDVGDVVPTSASDNSASTTIVAAATTTTMSSSQSDDTERLSRKIVDDISDSNGNRESMETGASGTGKPTNTAELSIIDVDLEDEAAESNTAEADVSSSLLGH